MSNWVTQFKLQRFTYIAGSHTKLHLSVQINKHG